MKETIRKIHTTSEEKWRNLRKNYIGGSDAAAVAGLNPWKTPLTVYLEKTGQIKETEMNEAMEWGVKLEALVAETWAEKNGKKIRREMSMINPKYPFAIANIDRKVLGENAGLEVKTTSAWNEKNLQKGIPANWYCQVTHYMAVAGYDRFYLAVLIGGQELREFVIERDEEDINNLMKIEKDFWENHVLAGVMPPPVEKDTETLSEMFQNTTDEVLKLPEEAIASIETILNLTASIKIFESQKEEHQNRLKAIMGEHETAVTESYRVSWKPVKSTRFDSTTLKKEQPDLYQAYAKESISRRFDIKEVSA